MGETHHNKRFGLGRGYADSHAIRYRSGDNRHRVGCAPGSVEDSNDFADARKRQRGDGLRRAGRIDRDRVPVRERKRRPLCGDVVHSRQGGVGAGIAVERRPHFAGERPAKVDFRRVGSAIIALRRGGGDDARNLSGRR